MKYALLGLTAILLAGWFSPEISDTDFWWHLRTGQYLVETHSLPVPDPFAFTTALSPPSYAEEELTRHFNLTHEWLSEVMFYAVYRVGGFAGIVVFRSLVLAAFCVIVGWIAYRRTGGLYRSVAAALASTGVAGSFALDRPFIITFLFLAITIDILEEGRWIWALPPLMLVWANCHGGYFLGLVAMGAYVLGDVRRVQFWAVAVVSAIVSGLNPNGYRLAQILLAYRKSYETSRLLEWARPTLWPPQWWSVLLIVATVVLVWARRRVKLSDWLLFAAFTAAALTAQRNVILVGLVAPIVIVTYMPVRKWAVPEWAPAAAIALALGVGIARGNFFELGANNWKWPSGAADFLLSHRITAPMFNTYEHGGYLIWRLWPQERVFIDGRSLSESNFLTYARILYNHDESDGKSAQQLLDQYGIQVIVMNTFEYSTGAVYMLAPALADPAQKEWKLVYAGPEAVVFMRQPLEGVTPLSSLQVFDHMEAECKLHIEREPQSPRCARSLGQVFLRVGDVVRARRWLANYLRLPHESDPEAEQAFQQLIGR